MRKAFTTGSVILALMVAGGVQAKPVSAPKPPVTFESVDSDRDGNISREEVQYMDDLKAAFARLDGNADNKLTAAEYAKWARAAKPGQVAPTALR